MIIMLPNNTISTFILVAHCEIYIYYYENCAQKLMKYVFNYNHCSHRVTNR